MICKYCNKERGEQVKGGHFAVANVFKGKTYFRLKCNQCHSPNKKKRRHTSRKQLNEIKFNKKCELCGFDDWRALQHHHREGEEKLFEIGNSVNRGYSMEAIKKEMEKCQTLCANCHQILHHKERESNHIND